MLKRTLSIFTLFCICLLITISSVSAYWMTYGSTSDKDMPNNTAQLGNWCFKHCRIYNPKDNYRVGELVGYIDNRGNFRLMRVTKNVIGGQHINPNRLDKTGVGAGAAYNPNQLWFVDLTNEYVAFNDYYAGDFVTENDKLYIYVGDYTRATSGRSCSLPKTHSPTTVNCWGRPSQTRWLYGKVYWREVNTNLSVEDRKLIWNKHQVYYKGDKALFPGGSYNIYNSQGYIQSSTLNYNNVRECTLLRDNNTGVVGISPTNSTYWSCR